MKFPVVVGLLSTGLSTAFAKSDVTVAGGNLGACLKVQHVPSVFPNAPQYGELAEPFNLRLPYKPAVIILPENTQHVQDAVKCAAKFNYKVSEFKFL